MMKTAYLIAFVTATTYVALFLEGCSDDSKNKTQVLPRSRPDIAGGGADSGEAIESVSQKKVEESSEQIWCLAPPDVIRVKFDEYLRQTSGHYIFVNADSDEQSILIASEANDWLSDQGRFGGRRVVGLTIFRKDQPPLHISSPNLFMDYNLLTGHYKKFRGHIDPEVEQKLNFILLDDFRIATPRHAKNPKSILQIIH